MGILTYRFDFLSILAYGNLFRLQIPLKKTTCGGGVVLVKSRSNPCCFLRRGPMPTPTRGHCNLEGVLAPFSSCRGWLIQRMSGDPTVEIPVIYYC